jgi:glutathionylspermidine synthase
MCHRSLKENPDEAVKSFDYINQAQIASGILYNNKPLSTLLEPGFISQEEVHKINSLVQIVERGVEKIISIVLDNEHDDTRENKFLHKEVKKIIGLSDLEKEAISIRCGVDRSLFIHRLDLYYDYKNGIQILEFNTDSPGGYVDADTQCRIFQEVPHIRNLTQSFALQGSHISKNFYEIIREIYLNHYRSMSINGEPLICIAGLKEDTSGTEHSTLANLFTTWGLPALLADPREIKYKSGSLYYKSDRIGLIYRRLILFELIEKWNEVQDFILGVKNSDIPVLNPFRSAIGSNKSILAILSDDRFQHLFDDEVVSEMDRYLPWTRSFDQNTDNSLIKTALAEKEKYVLKKSISYGGTHVVVGKAVSDDQWKATIEHILSQSSKWIIQEYIDKTLKTYPYIDDKGLGFHDMVLNLNPFIVNGQYAGGMIRVSPVGEFVINVGKGGAQLPMFIYEELSR